MRTNTNARKSVQTGLMPHLRPPSPLHEPKQEFPEPILVVPPSPAPGDIFPESAASINPVPSEPEIPATFPAPTAAPEPTSDPAAETAVLTPTQPYSSSPTLKRKRVYESKDRGDAKFWAASVLKRNILCERHIGLLSEGLQRDAGVDNVLEGVLKRLVERGVQKYFGEVRGYISSFVREFYMTLKRSDDGLSLLAKVKGRIVTVTPDSIAKFLGCIRPRSKDIQYPRPGYEAPSGLVLAGFVCSNIELYRAKGSFTQGMLKMEYALLNKIIHYNIYPKGAEKLPSMGVIQLVYEILAGKVIDISGLMWQVMADFRLQSGWTTSLPFAFLVTTLCVEAGVKPGTRDSWVPPPLGPISYTTVRKAESHAGFRRVPTEPTTPTTSTAIPATTSVPTPTQPSSSTVPIAAVVSSPTRASPSKSTHAPLSVEEVLRELLTGQRSLVESFEAERRRRLEWERVMEEQVSSLLTEFREYRASPSSSPEVVVEMRLRDRMRTRL